MVDDHQVFDICMSEIDKCKRQSIGPYFIFAATNKYGWRCPPSTIPASELEMLLPFIPAGGDECDSTASSSTATTCTATTATAAAATTATTATAAAAAAPSNSVVDQIHSAYRKDTNSSPAVYCLQPLSVVVPDTASPDAAVKGQGWATWGHMQDAMMGGLRSALVAAEAAGHTLSQEAKDKYVLSITEHEIARGVLTEDDIVASDAWLFVRTINNIAPADPVASRYIDMGADGAVSEDSQSLLATLLKDKVPQHFREDHCFAFECEWDAAGITMETHEEHVLSFCAQMHVVLEGAADDVATLQQEQGQTEIAPSGSRGGGGGDDGQGQAGLKDCWAAVKEAAQHGRFARSRLETFFGRETLLGRIVDGVLRVLDQSSETPLPSLVGESKSEANNTNDAFNNRPLVVIGESGVGKTSLMAAAAAQTRDTLTAQGFAGGAVLIRFCGTSPSSSSGRRLVGSLSAQLALFASIDGQLPRLPSTLLALCSVNTDTLDYSSICAHFVALLSAVASAERPVVIFIDSLDQLNDEDRARTELDWLPVQLPRHTAIVVSTLPDTGGCTDALERRGVIRPQSFGQEQSGKEDKLSPSLVTTCAAVLPPSLPLEEGACVVLVDNTIAGGTPIIVGRLSTAEAWGIMEVWLAGVGRSLGEEQHHVVQTSVNGCPLPLYARLLFDACREWKSYTPVVPPPDSVRGMVRKFFTDLLVFGDELVSTAMMLIVASIEGLSEVELVDILSTSEDVLNEQLQWHQPPQRRLPPLVWARIHERFGEYLTVRGGSLGGSPLLMFFHRQFWEVAEEMFLPTPAHRSRAAALIGRYFSGAAARECPERGIAEQPTQFVDDSGSGGGGGGGTSGGGGGGGGINYRKLVELPRALTVAGMWSEVLETLTDVVFLACKSSCMLYDLIHDLVFAVQQLSIAMGGTRGDDGGSTHLEESRRILRSVLIFLSVQAPVLVRRPHLFIQQALNARETDAIFARASAFVARGADAGSTSSAHAIPVECKNAPCKYRVRHVNKSVGSDDPIICTIGSVSDSAQWLTRCAAPPLVNELPGIGGSNSSSSSSSSRDFIAVASLDGFTRLFVASTGTLKGVLRGHSGPVTCCSVSTRFVFTGSHDGTVRIYDSDSCRDVLAAPLVVATPPEDWVCSNDADELHNLVVKTGTDWRYPLWAVTAIDVSVDGGLFCVGTAKGTAEVYFLDVTVNPPVVRRGPTVGPSEMNGTRGAGESAETGGAAGASAVVTQVRFSANHPGCRAGDVGCVLVSWENGHMKLVRVRCDDVCELIWEHHPANQREQKEGGATTAGTEEREGEGKENGGQRDESTEPAIGAECRRSSAEDPVMGALLPVMRTRVYDCSFSPDGRSVAAASFDKSLKVRSWDHSKSTLNLRAGVAHPRRVEVQGIGGGVEEGAREPHSGV